MNQIKYIGLVDNKGFICGTMKMEFEVNHEVSDEETLNNLRTHRPFDSLYTCEIVDVLLLTEEDYNANTCED